MTYVAKTLTELITGWFPQGPCRCSNPRGWGLDKPSGLWTCGECSRPSRATWEKFTERERVATYQTPTGVESHSPAPQVDAGREAAMDSYNVSNSEIRTFKRCRRKWWLSYYRRLRLRREGIGAMALGNMVHSVLEIYYSTVGRDPQTFNWPVVLSALVEARLAEPALPEHLVPGMHDDAKLAEIMLRGYFEYLQDEGADSNLQIIGAEQEVAAQLGEINGYLVTLMGKLDVQALLKDSGDRVFVDHKTVANLSDLPKVGELDEQQRMYGLLQRLSDPGNIGGRAVGGMWNMLRKVKRTASAKPPFYGRAGVKHNETVFRTFYSRVWGEVYDMLALKSNLDAGADHQVVAYPNPTRDCSWDCSFFLVCARFDDGSDVESVLAAEYELHDPNARYVEQEKG